MRSPRINVALSVHGNAAYLKAALDSGLAQSFGDFELVIVEAVRLMARPPSSSAMPCSTGAFA
jgi:hypothetical protein